MFLRLALVAVVVGLVWWLVGYLPLPDFALLLVRVVLILALIWELLAVGGVVPSAFKGSPPPGG